MGRRWEGQFDKAAYEAARRVLEGDRERTSGEVAGVLAKRGRIVAALAAVWLAVSAALVFVNPELLLVAEIGWVAIVVFAVFFLFPAITARGNLDELYDQYAERLACLQAANVAMPAPASMEDLVAVLDFVQLPEEAAAQAESAPPRVSDEAERRCR